MADKYVIKRTEKPLPEGDGPPLVYFEVGLCIDGVQPRWNRDESFETEQQARAWIIEQGGEIARVTNRLS